MDGTASKRRKRGGLDVRDRAHAAVVCVAVVCVALLGCAELRPPLLCPEKGGPPWVHLETKHFIMQTNLSEYEAWNRIVTFERSFQAFSEFAFRSKTPPPEQIHIVVFDRIEDYHEIGRPNTEAFFTTIDLDDVPFVVMRGNFSDRARHVFQHELTHRFVRYFMPRAPQWLDEGLAEFYSSLRIDGGEVVFGEPSRRFYDSGRARNSRQWGIDILSLPSATELLSAPPTAFRDPDRAKDFYGASWLFVNMLMNGSEDYRRRFWSYVHRLADGTLAEDAWREYFYDIPDDVLDEAFRRFVAKDETLVRRAPFQPHSEPVRALSQMSDADVHLLWAKLLLMRGIPERSKAELEEALRQAPQSPEAHHWSALLALAQQRYADAQAQARLAMKVKPDEPRYLQALTEAMFAEEMARPKDKRDMTRLEASMQQLSKVAHSPSALNSLGWFYALMEKPDEGLPFARRAVAAEPRCSECLDTLALLVFQKGSAQKALELQRRAVSIMPESRSDKDMIERLRRYEQAVKSSKAAPKKVTPAESTE